MRILLTGGTGHLGRAVRQAAPAAGHELRVMSRREAPPGAAEDWARADLATGEGIAEAVRGVDAVIHAASDPRGAERTDVQGTRRLAEAARAAGVRHLVLVSIVGIDRIPFPYYRHKLAAETELRKSGVPFSILRAAQFHSFVDLLLGQADRLPLVLVLPSGFRVQSIAEADVARELCRVVASGPANLLPDLLGPEPMPLAEAASRWLRARGGHKRILGVRLPGRTAAAFRAGHNTDPHHPGGHETWDAWLRARYAGTDPA